jgi:hypothetical protein
VTTKACKKCGVEKDCSEYHKQSSRPDGIRQRCKSCTNEESKNYKVRHYERLKKVRSEKAKDKSHQDRLKQLRKTDKFKNYKKKWDSLNKVKKIAHYAANNAIRDGRLKRLNCAVCGDKDSHAHHEDYSNPLEVVFYCKYHHAERHIELRKMGLTWDSEGKPVLAVKNRPDSNEGTLRLSGF